VGSRRWLSQIYTTGHQLIRGGETHFHIPSGFEINLLGKSLTFRLSTF